MFYILLANWQEMQIANYTVVHRVYDLNLAQIPQTLLTQLSWQYTVTTDHYICVIDRNKEVLGWVSESDTLRGFLIDQLRERQMTYNCRITAKVTRQVKWLD